MGIYHSPHTHPTPIPMGIPIPTAALGIWAPLSKFWRNFHGLLHATFACCKYDETVNVVNRVRCSLCLQWIQRLTAVTITVSELIFVLYTRMCMTGASMAHDTRC